MNQQVNTTKRPPSIKIEHTITLNPVTGTDSVSDTRAYTDNGLSEIKDRGSYEANSGK